MTETQRQLLEKIHESFANGQGKQAVELIDEYGLYDFWDHYAEYMQAIYQMYEYRYRVFKRAAVTYHRIKNR